MQYIVVDFLMMENQIYFTAQKMKVISSSAFVGAQKFPFGYNYA